MAGRPKLLTRPPQIGRSMRRDRLQQQAADAPIVVITAPIGSGCTTAAAHIAAADDATVAWCRMAHGYSTAGDVVEMIAATVGIEIAPARRVIELADQLLDLFEVGPLSVVIDDYHLSVDGDLDRVIAECVDLIAPGSRLVVASATRPAGLIGLVDATKRSIIDATDLAFTDSEARALFAHHGADEVEAERWNRELGGWAQGVVAGAHSPDGNAGQHLERLLDELAAADPTGGNLVDALASLDYVTLDVLAGIGLGVAADQLAALVDGSPLLADHAGFVRMSNSAADARRAQLPSGAVAERRVAAAGVLADDDPTTAIDLLLEAGAFERAADVLADHLSEIGVDRALNWLYRLPADLRRRFPPVLAAGQATVEVDTALADAHARVETATTERSRREALFALGSIEAHRGELAAAAGALEGARRAARGDDEGSHRIGAELANTRWLLGDLVGARAALADIPDSPPIRWLRTQLDIVERSVTPVDVDELHATEPYALSAAALMDLVRRDPASATATSEAAYRAAAHGGGEPFVAASVARAWALLMAGNHDDAFGVAEQLERRLGPRHQLACVHGAIIRERVARSTGDSGRHEREQRRLRDLRARGYAPIERLAEIVLDGLSVEAATDAVPVMVEVIGQHRVQCAGRTIRRSDWKSKKALDVLTVLAACGPSGARREQIVEAIWPGRDPDKGRTLLRTALSEVRRVLEPDRPAGESSRFLTANDDLIALNGALDLDVLDGEVSVDPVGVFSRLAAGLAPTIAGAEWAQEWVARIERLTVLAASSVPENAERLQRIEALEALIAAEPWQRRHYDRLTELHRSGGDEPAAADVERRWFADD